MKVVILAGIIPNLYKCFIVENSIDDHDILEAHSLVYPKLRIEIKDVYTVFGTFFKDHLEKLPQIRKSFVTVSFEDPQNIPRNFYSYDQLSVIAELVGLTNKMSSLIMSPIDFSNDDDKKLILRFDENNSLNGRILRLDIETEFENLIYCKYIIFNDTIYYNSNLFQTIFPEFSVTEYTAFPRTRLAHDLFWFKANSLRTTEDDSKTITKIREFFNPSYERRIEPYLDISEIYSSDQEKEIFDTFKKRCTESDNVKIKSIDLYENFQRSLPPLRTWSHKKFSGWAKRYFKTSRTSDGIFYHLIYDDDTATKSTKSK